jgi:hypothetical protein
MRKFAVSKSSDCASIAGLAQPQNASEFELRDSTKAAHRGRSCVPCENFQISLSPNMDTWIAVAFEALPSPDARH